jgi:hypothetical protein
MIFHILTSVLIVLKLLGLISIGWALVLLPSLFVLAVSVLFVAIAVVVACH